MHLDQYGTESCTFTDDGKFLQAYFNTSTEDVPFPNVPWSKRGVYDDGKNDEMPLGKDAEGGGEL
jgi:hypothetical protein